MKIIKKLVLAVALIGGVSSMSAQLAVGGGVAFNEGIDAPGLFAKAEFEIMDNIAVSPSVSYFSGSQARYLGSDYKNNLFAVDLNGLYKIEVMMDELDVYPLAGLNYSSYNNGFNANGDQSKGNNLGLNVGGGGRWKFADQLSVFADLKYTIADLSQVVLGAGILYEF